MNVMRKLIFGIDIEFKIKNEFINEILKLEFDGYEHTEKTNVIVEEVLEFQGEVVSRNPSIHFEYEDGFLIKDRIIDIRFRFNENKLNKVEFKLNELKGFRSFTRKILNNQFTNRGERIGQIIHEKILVPISFFQASIMPIHCSALAYKNQAYLFGGTGGVGKTSIELLYGSREGVSFISDDIGIINEQGKVYKNLNYPKIYAYNAVGNKTLKKKLVKSKLSADNLHWLLTKKIRGVSMVRRRIDPEKFYGRNESSDFNLKCYYFLVKSNIDEFTVKNIDGKLASKLSLDIIKTEYNQFFRSLNWHSYNCNFLNKESYISTEELFNKWQKLGEEIFSKCETKLILLPINYEHSKFINDLNQNFNLILN